MIKCKQNITTSTNVDVSDFKKCTMCMESKATF